MVRAVVFDADETVIDLRPAVSGALAAVLEEMRRTDGGRRRGDPRRAGVGLGRGVRGSRFRAGRRDPPCGAGPRRSTAPPSAPNSTASPSCSSPAGSRSAARSTTRCPPSAALRPHYRLGLASNGNSRAERCGLEGEFAFELYAHIGGLPKKPAPAFFAAVAGGGRTREPSAIVHVGDSAAHDVVAAQAAGLRAVWLNRTGRPRRRPPARRRDPFT